MKAVEVIYNRIKNKIRILFYNVLVCTILAPSLCYSRGSYDLKSTDLLNGPAPVVYQHSVLWAAIKANGIVRNDGSSESLAEQFVIGPKYKQILKWMTDDLQNYLDNFDSLFAAKLERIKQHEAQRLADKDLWLASLKTKLQAEPQNQLLVSELERLTRELKPHGFAREYSDGIESGKKILYVDTWGVPFFHTGTQKLNQARAGVVEALKLFKGLDLKKKISFRTFTELVAVFTRPEFDDVRRYKLQAFPSLQDRQRFAGERSDAVTVGNELPTDIFLYVTEPLDLDSLSFSFGQRIHLVGFISHVSNGEFADGRIFTGPADFSEHDMSHAYFNLSKNIPGTPEQWRKLHREYYKLKMSQKDPALQQMMSLVYFHFTHESGYKTLMPLTNRFGFGENGFEKLIEDIREKIRIRHYYDWVPNLPHVNGDYERYLLPAFKIVSEFFKPRFNQLLKQKEECWRLMTESK